MKLGQIGEFGLIERLARRQPALPKTSRLLVGVGDDAALWSPTPGCDLLTTCDLLVASVHFDLKTTGAWALGAKALACGLSDVSAMGGLPRTWFVSLSIPRRKGL